MLGVKYGDYHISEWGLIPYNQKIINTQEAKTNYVEIEGRQGSLDLTDKVSTFKDISLVDIFVIKCESVREFENIKSDILFCVHGKKMKIIKEADPEYYWDGRVTVTFESVNHKVYKVTFTALCYPFKHRINSPTDWLWDEFSFEKDWADDCTGRLDLVVDRYYKFVIQGVVEGTYGKARGVTGMKLYVNNEVFDLKTNQDIDVFLVGDIEIVIVGNGRFTFSYERGLL